MIDYGNDAAEKAIKKLDKRIQDVYREAEQDLQKKMDEFVRKYKVKEQKYLEQVAEGKISQADFDAWKRGQVFQGRQWRTKQRSIADVLYRSGEVSTKIINEMALGVCAENVNWAAYTIEHGFGVDFGFNLYDETTVANLIKKEPDILPKWKIEKEKNYIWNKKKLNNAVTQGIIQGEKLDEIAKRVTDGLCGSNKNLMKTFASTAMTGAQNSGRNISYKNAQKLGINLKKEWLATLDMRTRSSHRKLDGKKAEIDEPFESEFGEIMYPGDPSANAADVYNCRCTMIADLVDYPAEEYERYDNIDGKPVKGMSYEEWAKAKFGEKDIITKSNANKKNKKRNAGKGVVAGVVANTIKNVVEKQVGEK
jgi:SPP1 gp7 family putative phage head morphogenesis protein